MALRKQNAIPVIDVIPVNANMCTLSTSLQFYEYTHIANDYRFTGLLCMPQIQQQCLRCLTSAAYRKDQTRPNFPTVTQQDIYRLI